MTTSPTSEPLDDVLLDRYIAGECTATEVRQVNRWIAAHPAMGEVVAQLRKSGVTPSVDAERDWERVKGVVERSELLSYRSPSPRLEQGVSDRLRKVDPRTNWWRGVGYSCAGVMAVLGIVFGVWATQGHGIHPRIMTYATGNGQRANITLPDGSTAMLNVASRLDVPADFGAGSRTLRLIGEALFTVAHHEGVPFTVTIGQTTARVLGTTFAVRRYATDTVTTVAVREGRVVVRSIVLQAGEMVDIGAYPAARVHIVDSAQFGFANGVLAIDRVPLRDAVADLDRWFDADIRIQDPMIARHLLQGTFAVGSLSDLAAMLEYTFNIHVVRDGRVLTLYPK